MKLKKLLGIIALASIILANSTLQAQCSSGYTRRMFDWTSAAWGPAYVGSNDYLFGTINMNITIAGTYGFNSSAGYNSPNDDYTFSSMGGHGGTNQTLYLDEISSSSTGSITITFAQAVRDVAFSLYDVDNSDYITITARNGSTSVSPTLTAVHATPRFAIVSNNLVGTGSNSTNTRGTANVAVNGLVTEIVITSSAFSTPNYALTNIYACVQNVTTNTNCSDVARLKWDSLNYIPSSSNQTFTVNNPSGGPSVNVNTVWTGDVSHFISNYPAVPTGGDFMGNGGVTSTDNGLELLVDAPAGGVSSVTLTSTFSMAVSGMRFSVNDIDNSTTSVGTTNRIDKLTVTGYNGTTKIPTIFISESDGPSFGVAGDVATAHSNANYDGVGNTSFSSASFPNANAEPDRGTLNIYFASPIDKMILKYDEASGAADPYTRGIEIDMFLFCAPAALPVKLVSFDGLSIGENKNRIVWQTATEEYSKIFELQKLNAEGVYKTIYTTEAKGFSYTLTDYEFIDENVIGSISQYRLKEIDNSGEEFYSDVITIFGSKKLDLNKASINPNPAKDVTTIYNILPNTKVNIMDLSGKIVKTEIANSSDYALNLVGLTKGIYLINLTFGNQCKNIKLIKE